MTRDAHPRKHSSSFDWAAVTEAVEAGAAALVVVDPNGRRTRVPLFPFPFRIGRAPDNNLVLRDSRVSRNHVQIAVDGGRHFLEDLGSRHGVWVNGTRIEKRHALQGSERIEFGVPDGYQVLFTRTGDELQKLIAKPIAGDTGRSGANLEKLRAVLEVGRSLQSAFSIDDVLNTVVDAALSVTGAERGFLLLFNKIRELEMRSARSFGGQDLPPEDLRVPSKLIQRALESRRDLFSMSFNPSDMDTGNTIAMLDLRSVACLPLVRVNLRGMSDTQAINVARNTEGVLYLDSRLGSVDLAGGNRELLQTLAIEASTVLENARLLDNERLKQKIEEELDLARRIQQSLLPRSLPHDGWLRVCGSSEASHQVGGDYFDVVRLSEDKFTAVVADVSGKGVSSALLASFLQGAFLSMSCTVYLPDVLSRINDFLSARNENGKYATVFYSTLDRQGLLTYVNAGHCAPILIRKAAGEIASGETAAREATETLTTTSMPIGLVPEATFAVEMRTLQRGDRLVLYTDGVTEAQNEAGDFYGRKRLRESIESAIGEDCDGLYAAIHASLTEFTQGAEQSDDVTLLVLEYDVL